MAKEKTKKSIFKKWWFWVIAIIVIGGIAAAGEGDDSANTSSNTKKSSETASTTAATTLKKEKTNNTFKMGQDVKVGDMVYKINKKNIENQVGPSALPTKANGKYIVVNVTLKNNGKDAVTVDSSFFNLKRKDKTYEADATASMSANQGENGQIKNSFFLQKVNPDSQISGNVVFDVSSEVSSANDLQIQVQTGAFGTEKEVINLH